LWSFFYPPSHSLTIVASPCHCLCFYYSFHPFGLIF
jgi:hypothetical protein